ncbi:hypothetical protein SeMB42_g04079 [Synchytrium endobioticum]|uniref:Palmitoyltransferase n=1 Tax=Synchytrium endobioticum TaxID=286115 RepID=A0A507CYL3_9FUNG|nr:hypothetical protein SeLEV6574_g04677 [Synchytrium endobioticum]TPX45208.1 hypothetical protein SeMB42_g04079 [Synchytrium endobioticum]
MGMREWGPYFQGLVVILITGVPLSSVYFVFYENLPPALSVIFIIPVIMAWANYSLAVTTTPGSVPTGHGNRNHQNEQDEPPLFRAADDLEAPALIQLKKSGKKWRWCRKCELYKPPRTHHCRECGTCVLRMDHHCPWLNNCVGHYNTGHFLRFLIWTTASVVLCLGLHGYRLAQLLMYQSHLEAMRNGEYLQARKAVPIMYVPPATNREMIAIVVNAVILIIAVLSVGMLTAFQTYYAMTNVTTIESMENDKIVELMNKGRIPKVAAFPYDLGWYRNVSQVLGPRWYLWLLPQRQAGDGCVFPVAEKLFKEGNAVMWPPDEYYEYRRDPYGLSRGSRHGSDYDRGSAGIEDSDPGDYSGDDDGPSAQHPSPDRYSKPKPGRSSGRLTGGNLVSDDDDTPIARTHRGRKIGGRHVRRGSEGYVVREFTPQEREAMVRDVLARSQNAGHGGNGSGIVGSGRPTLRNEAEDEGIGRYAGSKWE